MGKIVGGNTNGGVQVDLRQFVGKGFMFQFHYSTWTPMVCASTEVWNLARQI